MIPIGQEQHLSFKAFFLFSIRRMTLGVVFLFLTLFLTLFGNYFGSNINTISNNVEIFKTSNINFSSILLITCIVLFFISIFFILIGILIAWLEYRNYSYRFDELNFLIKTGILNKIETLIPYHQVEDVHINRSLLYQILGLSRVDIKISSNEDQASQSVTEVIIDMLDRQIAEEIRGILAKKIGIQIMTDKQEESKV